MRYERWKFYFSEISEIRKSKKKRNENFNNQEINKRSFLECENIYNPGNQ